MIIETEDEKTIQGISLISGISTDVIEKVFASFQTQFVLNYKKNKSIRIPYIGSFLVKFRKDEITSDGKEAQVDAFYAPHPQVKRLVGQLEDAEISKDYTKLDVFTFLKKIIKRDLKTIITDEDRNDDLQFGKIDSL